MKKIAFATAAVTMLLTGAASAADLAARPCAKAPAMPVAVYNWTGFYIGANGGGAWSDKCWDIYNNLGGAVVPSFREGCHTASGAHGGQVGLPLAGQQLGLRSRSARQLGRSLRLQCRPRLRRREQPSRIDALGLFTGQVGYSWNNVPLVRQGGAAVTRDKYEGVVTGTGFVFDRATETRWVAWSAPASIRCFPPTGRRVRIRSPVHGSPRHLPVSTIVPGVLSRGETIRQTCRHGHRPHRLPLRRPDRRQVLSEIRPSTNENKSPGIVRGFFVGCVDASAPHTGRSPFTVTRVPERVCGQ